MRTKTRLLAVAAASALTVATAVPALALENEFHGMFRLRAFVSNFDDGAGGTQFSPDPAKPGALNKNHPGTSNYVEQRARLMYIAKANDDLKLVTHFEIDSRWGDNSYNSNGTTRNNGGAIGADQTNLETKNVYLDFNIPSAPVNVKLGLQFWNLGYKGIILNDDQSGVSATAKLSNGALNFAYFRLDDALSGGSHIANGSGATTTTATGTTSVVNTTPGNRTRDFLTVGGKYNLTKDLKVGADYVLLYSDVLRNSQDRTNIHMIGANAEYAFGPALVDGFFVYQTGKLGRQGVPGNGQTVNAFAANLGGRVKAGPGTARANFLYISGDGNPNHGDRNDFQTIMERGATTNAHGFNASEMVLMLDNKYNLTSAQTVVKDLNNNAQGLIGGFLGYDLNIDRFFVYSNLGFGAVAKDNGFGPRPHASNFLGTELNTEVGYKLYENMTVSLIGAYMLLGDYFKGQALDVAGADPENPYTARLMINYTF
jgi:hypothetical protein